MEIKQTSDTLSLVAEDHEWLYIANSYTLEERTEGYKRAYKSIEFKKVEFGKGKKRLLIVSYGEQKVLKELDFKVIGSPCSNSREIFFYHSDASNETKILSFSMTANGIQVDLTKTTLRETFTAFFLDALQTEEDISTTSP